MSRLTIQGNKFTAVIDSIIGGMTPSLYEQGTNQYLFGRAIDPSRGFAVSASRGSMPLGTISPIPYATFSGAEVNSTPQWILTNPKNTKIYAYLANGKLVSYDSILGTETLETTITSSSGNGAVYYNDFYYLFKNTDVARWGALSGTPAVTQDYWTGTGTLNLAALTNTTYPIGFPNHAAHVHTDGALYFCDFHDSQGFISKIKTTDDGTDDGSEADVLDLPFGYMPTDIESYGSYLVISAIQTSDTVVRQGKSAIFFWDTVAPSFEAEKTIELQDIHASALLVKNGELFVFSGNGERSFRVSRYIGGRSLQTIASFIEKRPPTASSVDSFGDSLVFGPGNQGDVYRIGYNEPGLSRDALNGIALAGSNITAVKHVQQNSQISPRVIVGSGNALYAYSSGQTSSAEFVGPVFHIGRPFKITKFRIPLFNSIAANGGFSPGFITDVLTETPSNNTTLIAVSNTNYSGSKNIVQTPIINANQYFAFRLSSFGSANTIVGLPITIEGELTD